MPEQCDCEVATQLLLDVRASLREEEDAFDEYLARGLRLQEYGSKLEATILWEISCPGLI